MQNCLLALTLFIVLLWCMQFQQITTLMLLGSVRALTRMREFVETIKICEHVMLKYPVNKEMEELVEEMLIKLEDLKAKGYLESNKNGDWRLSEEWERGFDDILLDGQDQMEEVHNQHDQPVNPDRPYIPNSGWEQFENLYRHCHGPTDFDEKSIFDMDDKI